MKNVIDKVRTAFDAKRVNGPASDEFKAAQLAAMEEINASCKCDDNLLISTHDKNDAGREIGIRIQKRGEGAKYCSYVLEIMPGAEKQATKEKRHPWPYKNPV